MRFVVLLIPPVVLDFGLVKQINWKLRMAFCKLLVAANEMDVSAVLCALGELGVGQEASLARPDRAMQFIRFAFRDAEPNKSFNEQREEWRPDDDNVEDTFSDLEEEDDEERRVREAKEAEEEARLKEKDGQLPSPPDESESKAEENKEEEESMNVIIRYIADFRYTDT